jgi:hypothetical protein
MDDKIILCACGCGQAVTIRKGIPRKFINHHYIRVNNPATRDSFRKRMTGENNPAKRPEVRLKISQAVKGKNAGEKNHMKQEYYKKLFSEKFKGEKNPMYGRKLSEEHKKKLLEGIRNHVDSLETRQKKSMICKGVPKSEEHKRKISETFKKNKISDGANNPFYGKSHDKKTKFILSKIAKERFKIKENHPSWKGGISFEPYTKDFDDNLKEKIRNRDNNICQNPNCNKLIKTKGDIHHINYIKKDCTEDNLITLCKSCHTKTNNHREYWQQFYEYLILLKKME